MSPDSLRATQLIWRTRLLDGAQALAWPPGREIVAQLLLYLDQPETCWYLVTRWLRELLDADRADGGWGGFVGDTGAIDYRAVTEHQRPRLGLPPVLGQRFSARSPALVQAWQTPGLHAIPSVPRHLGHVDPAVRDMLLAHGTQAKLALPLWSAEQPVGIMCADWCREAPDWPTDRCAALVPLCRQALGPLLGQARDRAESARHPAAHLTAAERQVARCIVEGLSYKEIAHRLQRSLSTIDHHLRSLRAKCGASSTARLAHWLREHDEVLR